MPDREIIFEFKSLDDLTQVRAIDPLTGHEVAITTPANTPKQYQMTLAKRKLFKALGIEEKPPSSSDHAPHGRGRFV